MLLPNELIQAELVRREKRFLGYVRLPDGSEAVAHCPNPGSMRGNAEPGSRVWLRDYGAAHEREGRKLRYRWMVTETKAGPVCVDTSLGNVIVGEALRAGLIPELTGYASIRAEVTSGDSRFDFALDGKGATAFVEVKSVSMAEPPLALFPDSPTERGRKHLRGLAEVKAQGGRAVIFFLVMRSDCTKFAPAAAIDPEYAKLLAEAAGSGVEVLVYDVEIRNERIELRRRIPWP